MCGFITKRAHAGQHSVQKTILLFHFGRIIGVAGMYVHGCHGDRIALRRFDIGFDPTPRIHILAQTWQTISLVKHFQVGEQPDSRAAFHPADLVHGMEVGRRVDFAGGGVFKTKFIENRIDIVLRRANLLHAPDIRCMLAGPILDALALGRTNAVDVRRGNGDGHAAILLWPPYESNRTPAAAMLSFL